MNFFENVKAAIEPLNIEIIGVVYKDGFLEPKRDKYPDLDEFIEKEDIPELSNRNKDLNIPLEIIYTSGTTGDPKGVVVKGDRLFAFKLLAQLIWKYSLKDKLYTGLSLTHGNARR